MMMPLLNWIAWANDDDASKQDAKTEENSTDIIIITWEKSEV